MKNHNYFNQWLITLMVISIYSFTACNQKEPAEPINEPETITTVTLSMYDQEAQESFFASYTNLDGTTPTIDSITFEAGKAYRMLVLFYDDSGQEEVSVNRQVEFEGLDHQICFVATGVVPEPLPQDVDENGNPVGIENFFGPTETGKGSLQVTLRHQPDKEAADACATGIIDVQTLAFPIIVK